LYLGFESRATYDIEQGVTAQSDGTDQLGAQSGVSLFLEALGAAQNTVLENPCQSRSTWRKISTVTQKWTQSLPCIGVNDCGKRELAGKNGK